MNEMGEVNVISMQYPKEELVDLKLDKNATATMTSSAASALDDSTPSDSGVQLLDSMSSDMNESFMSNNGFDFDGNISSALITSAPSALISQIEAKQSPYIIDEMSGMTEAVLPDLVMGSTERSRDGNQCLGVDEIAMTKSDIDNSNVDIPDEMVTSTCSTFDTDAIVYRRKVKKQRTSSTSSTGGSVKKRVSFHEDILKNTKTDNIHIEHGFVTYKGQPKKTPYRFLRNSWCSQGQCEDYADEAGYSNHRNACSDVLDYGKTEVYDENDGIIQFDNSGVFEYMPQADVSPVSPKPPAHIQKAASNDEYGFYNCKCSSSNSSLESNDNANGNDCKRDDYSRTKSNSCDCIGMEESNKLNNNGSPNMTDNCYFSEPCIETMKTDEFEYIRPKSVWCKELKPKSSCLKKTYRETDVILEHDVNAKVKTFNVHQLPDVNKVFGSLKNIFSITLPERGVPEGCEDLQTVYECVPETESPMKNSPQHPKTLDLTPNREQANLLGGAISKAKRVPELPLYSVPPEDEMGHVAVADDVSHQPTTGRPNSFRNKYIVNCESTVFEHTGVFFENRDMAQDIPQIPNSSSNCVTPQKPSKSLLSFSTAPFKQKLSNIFSSFRDTTSSGSSTTTTVNHSPKSASVQDAQMLLMERERQKQQEQLSAQLKKLQEEQMIRSWNSSYERRSSTKHPNDADSMNSSMTSSMISNSSDKNSIISSSTVTSSATNTTSNQERSSDRYSLPRTSEAKASSNSNSDSPKKKTRHLASPMRRKSATSKFDRSKLSPDLFCGQKAPANPMVLLSEEFDDLLTITTTTTDTESNENDIEIVDYSTAVSEAAATAAQMKVDVRNELPNQFLRPPSSKSSLINRFLRNVTQKKINDATIKKNAILSSKYREAPKRFSNLYVKPMKPISYDLAADLNAEIAQEMEAANNSAANNIDEMPNEAVQATEDFGVGVGEVSVDIFDVNNLHILRDETEKLIKVFKLYTGYNLQGHMTPVLVFLTNKTLYVTDLVRNRLGNRFVLPYTELDVILIGPHGNTVLLSNSARDMQQVLLAGGPYPADGLVSSLELCARRSGATLPAVGQLTLDHLAPLQKFVQDNSTVSKNEAWIYYAVVSVPANVLTHEEEPLGPNIKGPLMHRSISFAADHQHQQWMAGYFLLKAGVLYMFADSNKKLPSMVIALTECKGARRAVSSARPHCFEIMLKTGILQLAAPDEYVSSEWLQAVVQSASGLFDTQEKHKTLGCTLVITSNHLITLREDFASPLRRLNSKGTMSPAIVPRSSKSSTTGTDRKMSISTVSDVTFNDTCSNLSTPSKRSDLLSSTRTSPLRSQSTSVNIANDEKSFSSISSIYGKNSGVEVKTCAALDEMISVRIPTQNDQWWCILEFSCQEVHDNSDDMVIFFATNSDMRRFLSILETMWLTRNISSFPLFILPEDDFITNHCGSLFSTLNRSWEPLLSAALGFPQ